MTTAKQMRLKINLVGQTKQKMIRGHMAKEIAAATPHNQVSFILVQQAKMVSPRTIAAVVPIAVNTSVGSNH